MAIDTNADFTPSIPDSGVTPTKLPYNPTGSFKFWAQKVLPLVYDDSLSYYEVLCKVVDYLNNVIQNVDNLNDSVDSTNQSFETLEGYVNTTKDTLISTYNLLQEYVNDYFDNLDVQDEINAKLDYMADTGELSALLSPFIPDLVTRWLNEHVLPTGTTIAVDNTLTISAAAADSKVTGDRINYVESEVHDLSTVGVNLFNPETALLDKRARTSDGAIESHAGAYVSDFIPIVGGLTYRVYHGIGSASTIYSALFYDDEYNFVQGWFADTTDSFTIPTAVGWSYMRVNGSLATIDNQMVNVAGTTATGFIRNQRIINGKNDSGVMLVSSSNVYYDYENGILKTTGRMTIVTPDGAIYNMGDSVNVGSGNILFWNKETNTLYASDTIDTSETIYLIGWLNNIEYNGIFELSYINSAFPIFTINFAENKLVISVKGVTAQVYHKNKHYNINSGFSQTLNLADVCIVYFDPVAGNFGVATTNIDKIVMKGIPVVFKNYRNVTGICGVTFNTVIEDLPYKQYICFGDSLTWYDGHEFTWGEHEGETCVGFESYIMNELNARRVTNYGQSGKTTPEICTRVTSSLDTISGYDVITIMGGDNDDRLGVSVGTVQPVGGTFDTTTVCGALQNAIEQVLATKPSIRIILMTEPMGWTYENGALDRVSELIPNAYRNVAKQYGIPVIDLWSESGINELTRNTFYADPPDTDNVLYMYHPNNVGWVRLSKLIVRKLKQLC